MCLFAYNKQSEKKYWSKLIKNKSLVLPAFYSFLFEGDGWQLWFEVMLYLDRNKCEAALFLCDGASQITYIFSRKYLINHISIDIQ